MQNADGGGDLVAGHAPATQAFDALDHLWQRRLAQPLGPRAAILQAGQTFLIEAITPFAAGTRANAYGFTGGLPGALHRAALGGHSYGCPFGSPKDQCTHPAKAAESPVDGVSLT
jgi:hypothetical protein